MPHTYYAYVRTAIQGQARKSLAFLLMYSFHDLELSLLIAAYATHACVTSYSSCKRAKCLMGLFERESASLRDLLLLALWKIDNQAACLFKESVSWTISQLMLNTIKLFQIP